MMDVSIRNFSFAYPGHGNAPILEDISLEVEQGALCVVTGPTGCGKTTLLRCLKPELAPHGVRGGAIEVLGCKLGDTSEGSRPSPTDIGYVMQDPAAQIVCDTVWHELAFGLENAGTPQHEMRRRIAEVAHFFGIEPIMHAATDNLSGGQQQIVNLAAVLALRPRLLVLDEPCAQLDPEARRRFLHLLSRVNLELDITVIISTHAPEDTRGIASQSLDLGHLAPSATRADMETRLEARWNAWEASGKRPVLVARDLHVRYDPASPWILRGLDLTVAAGEVSAVVGGNGCGKSTLLKALAGTVRPQRGSVDNREAARQAYLPQDPKALLVCDTVADELDEWRCRCGYTEQEEQDMLERMGLAGLSHRHPFDLSGGQQQKLAIAKLLLTRPRLLFLDEPTKGLDPDAAADIIGVLRDLADTGCTVVMVTHDLDVALAAADEVSMLFDGELACTEPTREFFARNLLYRPHDSSRLFGALLQRALDPRPQADRARPHTEDAPSDMQRPRTNAEAHGPARNRANGLIEAMALVSVPIVLAAAALTGFSQTALLSFIVVLAALGIFLASYEKGGARVSEAMPTVVLAAAAAAGRMVFAALPSIKPVSAIAIIAGVTLGRRGGFMTGALAALVSNFFFGQGPWTPWQMYAWGLVGYGAGLLAQLGAFGRAQDAGPGRGRLRDRMGMAALLAYGFIASVLYGWILNIWSVLGFLHAGLNFELIAVYASSLPFDVAHGTATVIFLLALYLPWRKKITRVVERYGS